MAKTEGGKGNKSRAKKAPAPVSDEKFQQLMAEAASFEPAASKRADHSREREIITALLQRGASIEATVAWCMERGLSVSRRFVSDVRKGGGGGKSGGTSPGGKGEPPHRPPHTDGFEG